MQILFLFGGGSWDADARTLGTDYESRLSRTEKVSVQLINSKETDAGKRRTDEGAKMLKVIDDKDFVIAFDERGCAISSIRCIGALARWTPAPGPIWPSPPSFARSACIKRSATATRLVSASRRPHL